MPTDKFAKRAIVADFLGWLNSQDGRPHCGEAWIDVWERETFIECDQACAHGPGHQSITECVITTPGHTEHADHYGNEWRDEDLGTRTYDKPKFKRVEHDDGFVEHVRDGIAKTYRIYSGGY